LKLGGVIKYSLTGSVLAILYFILVTGLITGATYLLSLTGLLPDWTIWWGIILGAILGGTSSIVVMPLLKNAGFSEDKTNILSIESALTDALCVVVVLTLLTYLSTEEIGRASCRERVY
jgi:NhaP-type Na+/H+ or K+/H+ antiporter